MKKNIFLYPGQGAQFSGMLKEFCQKGSEDSVAANDVIALAEKITGENIRKYMWEISAEELARSDRSQIAICVMELALTASLKVCGTEGDVFAGFSLGEFAALYGSGVLSMEDTIYLVWQRGKIMQKVCDEIATTSVDGNLPGMTAVIGLSPEKVVAVVDSIPEGANGKDVFVANWNSLKQTVIAGTSEGLEKAEAVLKDGGARRVIRLKVAGPFHSPLMKKAANAFEPIMENVEFNEPTKILLSNVTGNVVKNPKEIKSNLLKHFVEGVRWTQESEVIANMIDYKNPNCSDYWKIYEVGPGNVLAGLWRDSGYAENISVNIVEI
ncbi:MAG: ACP S-malonyltransferase [Treponema sp.]|nr:ACP S-malonyltransferase [Treponema sp.]